MDEESWYCYYKFERPSRLGRPSQHRRAHRNDFCEKKSKRMERT
jgi:hypothetical protein